MERVHGPSGPEAEFCCEQSMLGGESIVATAVADTWFWLVLEHRPAWAAKAFENADLPASVRAAFEHWTSAVSGVRVQLVRRPRRDDGSLAFYVAGARPGRAAAVRFDLADVNDVSAIDVPAIARAFENGVAPNVGRACTEPLVLVCTHGKRDRCCAKWGAPLYERLAAEPGLDVWQTTHLGGHRFAPTLLVLPTGLCYGRIGVNEAPALADAMRANRVHRLDRLRGRTALSTSAMATEHFVRVHTGNLDHDVTIASVRELEHGEVESEARIDGRRLHLRLAWVEQGGLAPPSCGKPPEPIRGVVLRALEDRGT